MSVRIQNIKMSSLPLTHVAASMYDVYVSAQRRLNLEKRLSLVLHAASLDGVRSDIILYPSCRKEIASLN